MRKRSCDSVDTATNLKASLSSVKNFLKAGITFPASLIRGRHKVLNLPFSESVM
jgi:hypothetical protein